MLRTSRVAVLLAVAALAAVPARAQISAPVLKWQQGGCSGGYCEAGWYASPAVADIDGDGQVEVVWAGYDLVSLNGATGATEWSVNNVNRVWPGIVIADLTGNGSLEIVVGRSGNQVVVHNANGTFAAGWPQTAFPGQSGEVRTLAVADVDNNGTLEIVVGRASPGDTKQLNVFDAAGTIRPGWPARRDGELGYGWGMYNQNVAVGDLNGDGLAEIIGPTDTHYITALDRDGNQLTVNPIYAPRQVWSQQGVHVLHEIDLQGYADCGEVPPAPLARRLRPNFANSAPVIADVNGDGVREIVVVGDVYDCDLGDPDGDLYHLPWIFKLDRTRWSGSGFDWTVIPTAEPGSGPLSQDYSVIENSVQNVVVADLDNDGFKEILYPSYDGRLHAYWLDKTQHGNWPYDVPGPGFRFASEPVVADLNNDGQAEVIFTSWPQTGTSPVGQLHILDSLGNELHRVDLPAPATGATWNGGLAAPTLANLDADADLEVVVGTTHSGVVAYDLPGTSSARILWGTGRGSFLRNGVAPAALPAASINNVTLAEGNAGGTTFTFNVTLSPAAAGTVTVNWATAPNTATTPSDFATASGMVTFNTGESTKPVNVTVNGDTTYEINESFYVNLSAPSGATIADSQGVGTITNDDAMPAIAIDNVSMMEGNAGSQVYPFTVSLSAASGVDVTVDWAAFTVTATSGSDFAPASGSLTFIPGQTAKLANVTVNGDTLYETNEIFSVNLSNLVGATYADFQGVGTIANDDAMPTIAIDNVALAEGGTGTTTTFPFTVSLSAASGAQTTVNFTTADGTAISGSDYASTNGMLTFDPGQMAKLVNVTVNGDGMLEPNETFFVNLSGAVNATIFDNQGLGTIANDDVAPARVFVSVLGLDTNDCSNIATPCRTLNAAIAQAATDGEVIVIRSGSYAGATITKGVKIDAAAGVVAFSGQSITVNAPGGTVVIRGLTLKAASPGSGTGLQIQSAAAVFLENSVVDGWAIGVEQGAPEAFFAQSTLRNNNSGLHSAAGKTSLEDTRFENNATGIAADSASEVSLRGSMVSGNGAGITADTGSVVTVEKTQITNNGTGVKVPLASGATVRLSRSVVSGNTLGLENAGGTIEVSGNNVVRGNVTDTAGSITTTGLQ